MSSSPPLRAARLAVVTPLANERDTLDNFIARVLRQLSPGDRLICVFDRVCTDGSLDRARQCAQHEPRLLPVFAPENRCVVDAYFRGYREALAGGFDWILEMDGGFSHLPEQIPRFLQAMSTGVDYAGGSRFLPGASIRGPLQRRLISRGGTLLTNMLLGTRMTDMTSGFECFSRRAMEAVLQAGIRSRAHFFQTEIRCLMHRFRWIEVPIDYLSTAPPLGSSPLTEALRILWILHRQRRRTARRHGPLNPRPA